MKKETTIKHNYSGSSLLQLRKKFGISKAGFYDNSWWINEKFAKEKPPKGIYELNLSNDLNNLTYEEQKSKLEEGWKVAHPAIVTDLTIHTTGCFIIDGKWSDCHWNFEKDLDNQSEPIKKFIADLL